MESLALYAKNLVLKTLPKGVPIVLGSNFVELLSGESLHVLLGHGGSGRVLGLKLLVGRRWREFHCLATSRGVL